MKRIALIWWKKSQIAPRSLDRMGLNSYFERAGHLPQMIRSFRKAPGSDANLPGAFRYLNKLNRKATVALAIRPASKFHRNCSIGAPPFGRLPRSNSISLPPFSLKFKIFVPVFPVVPVVPFCAFTSCRHIMLYLRHEYLDKGRTG